jgi:hypothetical protein
MNSTDILVPEITGLPTRILGSTAILSLSSTPLLWSQFLSTFFTQSPQLHNPKNEPQPTPCRGGVSHSFVVECARQPGMLVSVLPVHNRVANQQVKERIVSRRNRPAHACLVESRIAEEKLSLVDKLFRRIDNQAACSIHEMQVGMQPDLIGANEAKKVSPHILRQSLQFCGRCPVTRKNHIYEHSGLVAPVDANVMIDSLHQRIAGVLRSQAIDPARNFLACGPFIQNDRHPGISSPAYRARPEA